jgi:hypothetical protein
VEDKILGEVAQLVRAQDSSTEGGQVIRLWRTWVQKKRGRVNKINGEVAQLVRAQDSYTPLAYMGSKKEREGE